MKHYDIAIIGAGPAGAMLARLLGKKAKLAIFDARPMDRVYEPGDLKKSCGGLIAPDAAKFLWEQGIFLPDEVLAKVQSKWVKTVDLRRPIVRLYQRDYVNVDREAFDRFLLEGIEADKYFSYRVRSIKKEDGYVINNDIKAKVLVGADGANSMIRRQFFPDFKGREYVSVQEYFPGGVLSDFECYFDEELTDYYGWAFSKNEGKMVGLAVPKGADSLEKFKKFKEKLGLQGGVFREGAVILRPKWLHPVLCEKDLFLIGEAGGYISPSSAEGLSFAFKTASILAESGMDAKVFRRKMRKIRFSLFMKNLKSVFMYQPILRFLIMALSIRKNPTKDRRPRALGKLRKAKR